MYANKVAGIELPLLDEELSSNVYDVQVPDGPLYIVMWDDNRRFELLVVNDSLGEQTPAAWLSEGLSHFGVQQLESTAVVDTEYGKATVVELPALGLTMAVLPVGERIFYVSYDQCQ